MGDIDPDSWTRLGCRRPGARAVLGCAGADLVGADDRLPARLRGLRLAPPVQGRPQAPPKQLVKKPTRKRQRQEEAFSTLPGKSPVAVPFEGGSKFAVGMVLGRPITLDDGRFGRNFKVTEIIDRSAFDYPALLQDPRVFFPVPAL